MPILFVLETQKRTGIFRYKNEELGIMRTYNNSTLTMTVFQGGCS